MVLLQGHCCTIHDLLPNVLFKRESSEFAVCQVLTDRVTEITVDPAFPLLQVDWIGWQIPVHDFSAVVVEVKPFLPDGCCCQHEWTEGGIEGASDVLSSLHGLLIDLSVKVAHCKVCAKPGFLAIAKEGFPRFYLDTRSINKACLHLPQQLQVTPAPQSKGIFVKNGL